MKNNIDRSGANVVRLLRFLIISIGIMEKEKTLAWVKDPRHMLDEKDELQLFQLEMREVMFEYLQHHSLSPENQPYLFEPENEDVLDFFIHHWVLNAALEAKLFTVEYRHYLRAYIERGCLHDADNEMLLFTAVGITKFRRMYIERHGFHNRNAEAQLFAPEYETDLRIYVEHKHILFSDFVDILKAEHPELYAQYQKYCPQN